MKSVFVSHKFTGLSFEEMDSYLKPLVHFFESKGVEVFCSLYLEERFQSQGRNSEYIYERCCEQQKQYDISLGIIRSDQDSYGMNLEQDHALFHNKPYVLLYKNNTEQHDWIYNYKQKASRSQSFVSIEDLSVILDTQFANLG